MRRIRASVSFSGRPSSFPRRAARPRAHDEKLIAQLTSRHKLYDSKGRERLESKADLAARGVESQDRADALIGATILGIGRRGTDRLGGMPQNERRDQAPPRGLALAATPSSPGGMFHSDGLSPTPGAGVPSLVSLTVDAQTEPVQRE
jgi:hypothetical protein